MSAHSPMPDRVKIILDYVRQQRFDLGLAEATQWLSELPLDADAHYWKGYCEMRSGNPSAAEASLRGGLRSDPRHAECQSLLGRSLFAQGRVRDALEAAERAAGLDSRNPEVWDAIGVVYGNLGEYQRALEVFRKVAILRPNSARNLFNLASMLNFCDQSEEAEHYYREALAIEPTKFIAYWSLAQLRKQRPENNHAQWLLQTHKRFRRQPEARLYVSMALAKTYEDLEDYDEAFAWLQRGNEEKRRQLNYHTDTDRALFARIRKAFAEPLEMPGLAGYESREPIFILGLPRTGTTLLEQIVCGHEAVFAAGELQNFLAETVQMARARRPGLKIEQLFDAMRQFDYRELGRRYVLSTRPRTGQVPYFIDKMPNNFLYLGAIARALPQARILHLRRNPMDTCFSNYKQLFGANACPHSYRLSEMAAYYQFYRELMAHWRRTLPGRIFDVDYESLVAEPETTARRVYDHLQLSWRDDALRFHERARPVGTASTAQIRLPVYASSVDKWRLYERHLEPLRNALADLPDER